MKTAKLWTKISAKLSGVRLVDDIPEDNEDFEQYGPDFAMTETPIFSQKMTEDKKKVLTNHIAAICEEIKKDREDQTLVKLPSRPRFKRRKLALE